MEEAFVGINTVVWEYVSLFGTGLPQLQVVVLYSLTTLVW